MATVGNLFVNIRGRTGGLVRDLRKANKSVQKDFYRNEALARQRYLGAAGRLSEAQAKGMSPAVRSKRLRELQSARVGMAIARTRPARLEQRRELLAAKERGESMRAALAREAKALIPLVLGVPAAALAFIVRQGVKSYGAASKFAVMGPSGGRFIEATVGKMMDEMAFAQRADVSDVMARTAELERQNAFLWREVGLQFQIVLNALAEELGLDITGQKIKGDPGFVPGKLDLTTAQRRAIDQSHRIREAQRTGETILPPPVGSPYFGF